MVSVTKHKRHEDEANKRGVSGDRWLVGKRKRDIVTGMLYIMYQEICGWVREILLLQIGVAGARWIVGKRDTAFTCSCKRR